MILLRASVLVCLFLFAGCSAGGDVPTTGNDSNNSSRTLSDDGTPEWVNRTPTAPGKLYAVGTASDMLSESTGRNLAAEDGRAQLVRIIESKVSAELVRVATEVYSKDTLGNQSGSLEQTVGDSLHSEAEQRVRGTVPEDFHIKQGDKSMTVYALVSMPRSLLAKDVANGLFKLLAKSGAKPVEGETEVTVRQKLEFVINQGLSQ